MEQCQCVCPKTGWQPSHIAVYDDNHQTNLLGVMPCYIKQHSYGEYIFDWAWADAYQRYGFNYYPKLCNAVPFTPATGPRWLINSKTDQSSIGTLLTERALRLVEEQQLSSFHSLFLTQSQAHQLSKKQFLQRHSTQFHWHNHNYIDFNDFLSRMSSKKRKNIKRERRRVIESDVHYQWLTGNQLNRENAALMHQFYARTITYYGAQAYLNKDFFEYLSQHFADQTLFLFAKYDQQIIAGGLYFKSDDTLYGRYWGALSNFHSLHFETCYYQPVEWCIKHDYQHFEAGAQGEHKLARGLEPTSTYSAHWIQNPQFRSAIGDFLQQEQQHISQYSQSLKPHSPYKTEL